MKKQLHQQLTIDIAGPGSGKTTSLIDSVKSYARTNDLRDVAVITYTNFARDRIEDGLFKLGVNIEDVFIGTIHSFLIRYVISPFAHKYEEDYPANLKYAEVNTAQITDPVRKAAYINNLMKKGVIPYGKVESFARKLLKNKEVAKAVAGKIQAIFVDEYQDATTTHHAIFETLIKSGISRFYCVGDGEQYIYGFTYRGRKPPVFSKIPMNTLASESAFDKNFLKTNWRSAANIVSFLNNFVDESRRQIPDPDRNDSGKLVFMESNDLSHALEMSSTDKRSEDTMMILAYASSILETGEFASIPMGARDSSVKHRPITAIVTDYICNFLKSSKQTISDREGLNAIGFRGKIVEFADRIDTDLDFGINQAISLIKQLFPATSQSNEATNYISPDEYLYVVHAIRSRGTDDNQIVKMTIHKAKGLEADNVLVVASTNIELAKWIGTDLTVRSDDKNDTCRVGFVAFSRARKNLYVACQEVINENNKAALLALGVEGL